MEKQLQCFILWENSRYIEQELIVDDKKRAHFIETLESEMVAAPKDWEKYYNGTERKH